MYVSRIQVRHHVHSHPCYQRSASMSFLVSPFSRPSRAQNAWFMAGLASLYPNLDDETRVGERRPCGGNFVPGCRVFHVPSDDSSKATEIAIDDWKDPDLGGNAKDQVMVFQYRGKFFAVNHVGHNIFEACPPRIDSNTCRNARTHRILFPTVRLST